MGSRRFPSLHDINGIDSASISSICDCRLSLAITLYRREGKIVRAGQAMLRGFSMTALRRTSVDSTAQHSEIGAHSRNS